ncbi:electron transfer flavoprotein subunit beta/FixA family protein [Muricomes intestini]|jgi:electron transfer flavoprotein beta subunit|uniref:Electron transfer flavoprotein small subunit n=4 Tax=Muricomes intestini TaxID=1796634 RepID=A0A4R3KHW2_9FIRM|nr:electron transfer flavoprotein subunit beta/FixA family protein [Muricomes intestini]TCS82645.1 electron transfer flavoprotein beta subunit [Muricomes intestini]HAX52758.1 electron transfer flavoprotein subunit beta/FixA family protein [Lachnospiraceae bacterium]HCR84938.1 electron transfer flavoprotein subunit beta/FixA family protein [Lachnospiraceae bacterium]
MNIAVLMKQVPVSNDVSVDPETHALIRSSSEGMINPADLNAIEAALQLKEQTDGKAVVFTMGPQGTQKALIEAMGIGCDESVLITDRCFAGGDTIATAKVLARGIKKYGEFDLILSGALSADGATGQVGAMVAEYMDAPYVGEIQGIKYDETDAEHVVAIKKYQDQEYHIKTELTAVMSVCFGSNEPRFATLRSMRKAKTKPLHVYTNEELQMAAEDIGLSGSPTIVTDSFEPENERRAEMFTGTPQEMAAKLKELIDNEKGKE